MRAKFFLKGMGIGVTVTAIIFTVAFALQPPTLSDEEIIARAKTLGMVESEETTLNQMGLKDEEVSESDEASEAQDTSESGDASEDKVTTEEVSSEELSEEDKEALQALKDLEDAKKEDAGADNSGYKTTDTVNDSSSEAETPQNTQSFTINNGEDSAVVSSRLYRQGIIDDPNGFDDYLTKNGYDTRIHPGSYNIPEGSSFETIANAIAN